MALRKKGKYYYGDSIEDLFSELKRYANKNEYPIDKVEVISCSHCKNNTFILFSDDEESSAIVQCTKCFEKQYIRDSIEYLDMNGELNSSMCLCDNKNFMIAVGISFYKDTNDARWVYVGGYCPQCGLVGNYIDWNER